MLFITVCENVKIEKGKKCENAGGTVRIVGFKF